MCMCMCMCMGMCVCSGCCGVVMSMWDPVQIVAAFVVLVAFMCDSVPD